MCVRVIAVKNLHTEIRTAIIKIPFEAVIRANPAAIQPHWAKQTCQPPPSPCALCGTPFAFSSSVPWSFKSEAQLRVWPPINTAPAGQSAPLRWLPSGRVRTSGP